MCVASNVDVGPGFVIAHLQAQTQASATSAGAFWCLSIMIVKSLFPQRLCLVHGASNPRLHDASEARVELVIASQDDARARERRSSGFTAQPEIRPR